MSQAAQYDPNKMSEQDKIRLTEAAQQHLHAQIAKRGSGIGIRFGIKKSGCTGYAYTVDIIDETHADEHVFDISDDLLVAVKREHFLVVKGTLLDYIREGINTRFDYQNPNETGGCGCGESFTVEDDVE